MNDVFSGRGWNTVPFGSPGDGAPLILLLAGKEALTGALRAALEAGASLEQAGLAALARLMAQVTDTNLLSRGGPEGQRWAAAQAERLGRPVTAEPVPNMPETYCLVSAD